MNSAPRITSSASAIASVKALVSSSDTRDHVLGVLLEGGDLLLQRPGVRSLDVGRPEADDAVGDALVGQPLHAVGVVGVVRDDVDLEVVAVVALGLADLGQAGQEPVQLLAVAAG